MKNVDEILRSVPSLTEAEIEQLLKNLSSVAIRSIFGGVWGITHKRNGEILYKENVHNIVPNQGLNYLLDVGLSAATAKTAFYIGLGGTNTTPLATWTAANVASNFGEATGYTEATRVAWTEAGVSSQSITNSASPAAFTINATDTIYGAFLCSESTKSGTSATDFLIAAGLFASSRAVESGDSLEITYTISAADDGV